MSNFVTPWGVNFKVREGTYDTQIIREVERSYGWLDVRRRNVMDVGGNIGAFSSWALANGARKVVAYEPMTENARLFRKNASEATLCRAALVTSNEQWVPLYVSRGGKNPGNTSTQEFRGRDVRRVPALNFREQLQIWRPSVIKMDCEGAEFDLLREPLPRFVKQIALEIHLGKKEWRSQAENIVEMFSAWDCVVQPKLGGKHWFTLAGWRR